MQPLILSALAVLFLLLQVALPAFAADAWPTRPIRLLVPFAPGGSTDITARVLAEGLRGVLGQTVVVDNRSGASGNIAGETAAKAIPDGYTFLISSTTLLVNMYIQKNPRYDYVKELAPVTQTNWSTNVLVVNPSVPAATLPEFIAHVKGGARVTYGRPGTGPRSILPAPSSTTWSRATCCRCRTRAVRRRWSPYWAARSSRSSRR